MMMDQNESETSSNEENAEAEAPTVAATPESTSSDIVVGLDLGTHMSCYLTSLSRSGGELSPTLVPTVVGYAEEGILAGILPGNASVLFAEHALANELHLRLVRPLSDGVIQDSKAARLFLSDLRHRVDPGGKGRVLAVIGVPACAEDSSKESLKQAAVGAFDGVLFIPEPFLAALGARDEDRLGNSDYVDPAANSLFIDIGAGTTDFCIVQGCFPSSDDQLSIPFGGDEVDEILAQSIKEAYPETNLPLSMIRRYKEEFSYVGDLESGIRVKAPVAGKPCKLEVGKQVGEACSRLLEEVFASAQQIISKASSESVFAMLGNIILTGGGSLIRNIGQELERLLREDGYENPSVTVIDRNSKHFVALGALKVAHGAREDQWLKP